jgi:hypothetical protein
MSVKAGEYDKVDIIKMLAETEARLKVITEEKLLIESKKS